MTEDEVRAALHEHLRRLARDALDPDITLAELVSRLAAARTIVSQLGVSSEPRKLSDVLNEVDERLQMRIAAAAN